MLTVVPTPIGNLGDITLRALEAFKEADVIACEDTRHTRKLLTHFEIEGKELIALHDHNEQAQVEPFLARLNAGESVALVSDAGMPLVSDPGFRIVRAVREAELEMTVLPGFLPIKKGKRRNELEAALGREETAPYFESPHRIGSTLEILAELAPEQFVVVARELSKKFETYHRGSATELKEYFAKHSAKGEIVILFNPV